MEYEIMYSIHFCNEFVKFLWKINQNKQFSFKENAREYAASKM